MLHFGLCNSENRVHGTLTIHHILRYIIHRHIRNHSLTEIFVTHHFNADKGERMLHFGLCNSENRVHGTLTIHHILQL